MDPKMLSSLSWDPHHLCNPPMLCFPLGMVSVLWYEGTKDATGILQAI